MPVHELHTSEPPAMTPLEIQELLKPAFDQARELQQQLDLKHDRIPFVTVSQPFVMLLYSLHLARYFWMK